ncbi:MAG TPA: hypothetical protein VIM70_07510 [Clostridium sp.]|uniref:hypothetical protein n=1 Tax=Clostridium sp. TaxID=1506 RepID=UPI002F93F5A8
MKNKKIITGILALIIIVIATVVIILNLSKVTYTKEFRYLPKYKNMLVNKFEPSKGEQLGNAVYYVSNGDYEKYLTKYQKVLEKDGWKITVDKKPVSIKTTKEKHIATINVVNADKKLMILIWTK